MAENNPAESATEVKEYSPGELLKGSVTGITSFGAFVRLPDGREGLVHISEIANTYVTNIEDFIKLGQEITVKVLGKNNKGKYDLSIKQTAASTPAPAYRHAPRSEDGGKRKAFEPGSFDEMMHNFMKNSEEVQLDVRRNLQYRQGLRRKGQKKHREE
ncbi:RNA-binding protein S1 [Candidatus Termititenax persephonae]|uniref:RNA-binding protein S1 n=1 Tax=Candidatus Termititenax persephonae TaxID=2218525 RepID=A0A388TID6_9BACT|nr:RNA-binding protein S1 [Candidatus Termititenax persephonae]